MLKEIAIIVVAVVCTFWIFISFIPLGYLNAETFTYGDLAIGLIALSVFGGLMIFNGFHIKNLYHNKPKYALFLIILLATILFEIYLLWNHWFEWFGTQATL